MKNKLKGIISGLLVLALLNSPLENSALAMNGGHVSTSSVHSTQANVEITRWTLPAILVATVSLAVAGTIGYFIGNRQYLKNSKEITFTGTTLITSGTIPNGNIYPIPLAQEYVNWLFKDEISKLNKNDTFPATHIAGLEAYLRLISSHFNSEPLGQKLLTMSQIMSGLIRTENKTVTVGYLVDLLKQSRDLINQAEAQSSTKSDL